LDQHAVAFGARCDHLSETPGQIDIGIVVPVVLKHRAAVWQFYPRSDLEITVRATSEVALDDATTPDDLMGRIVDSLSGRPRLIHIRVIVPVVAQLDAPRVVYYGDHNLEIAVVSRSEVALDDRRRTDDSPARFRDALAEGPRLVDIRVVVPHMPKLDKPAFS